MVAALLKVEPALETLVIDDASPHGTGDIAESLARETRRVEVLHREGKPGLGTAYVAGFEYALNHGYDRVVQMDMDLPICRPKTSWIRRALQYNLFCLGGFVISVSVPAALNYLVNLHYLVANIFAIGATLWNYGANRYWTWPIETLDEDTKVVIEGGLE